ncbi:unnamed protein product, partial [Rotaria sp. Silwood2]
YNSWACTQCRKACTAEFGDTDETKDLFEWLYDEITVHAPSTAASCFSQQSGDYESVDRDFPALKRDHEKREFKQWFAFTDYRGRCRSTENYCSLNRHDQKAFRSQMKAIFHHILLLLVPNDADIVWEDLVDDETKKSAKTKGGETADDNAFKPLGPSSLFDTLKTCGATMRKSLAGLDSFSCDGSTAFKQLGHLCDEVATYGTKPEVIVRLKQDLHDGCSYLKLDYRAHVSNDIRVADHCSMFGLSDTHNSAWQKKEQSRTR